jgi:thioredoxin reductase (NADPH)
MITGMQPGGQLTPTTEVDHWPSEVDGIQGADLMSRIQKHAKRFNTGIIFDTINRVDFSEKPVQLSEDNRHFTCNALIVSTVPVSDLRQ